MGPALAPPHSAAAAATPALRRLWLIVSLVRYRFFLYAGLIPYGLGAAWAWHRDGHIDAALLLGGLAGVGLAVIGVEAFNEFFDDRMGTDRVFNPTDQPPMSQWVLWLGVAAFGGALAIGLWLAVDAGWPILAFAGVGGLAAVFYVAPPVRWAYRGLGETVIALSYGPCMVLGSLYLQTRRIDAGAALASLVPGLLVMALAVVNAIPDFHQDRLVGKRNLCVRLGRQRAVTLYVALAAGALALVPLGVVLGWFPPLTLISLAGLPLLWSSARRAGPTCTMPRLFVPAIRRIVACYGLTSLLFTVAILLQAWQEHR